MQGSLKTIQFTLYFRFNIKKKKIKTLLYLLVDQRQTLTVTYVRICQTTSYHLCHIVIFIASNRTPKSIVLMNLQKREFQAFSHLKVTHDKITPLLLFFGEIKKNLFFPGLLILKP